VALALIDMAKPYVDIVSIEQKQASLEVTFRVNGCSLINSVTVTQKSAVLLQTLNSTGNCNWSKN
jgi:hypothetical protein